MLADWLKGWTNGAWMNGSLDTYTYDSNGNMVNELIQYWLNGLWTNYQQSTFTYDANGNELTGDNTLWSGSSWVPTDYNFDLAVSGSTYHFTGYRINISWMLVNTTAVSGEMSNIVKGYSLSQNYPNPFNPTTVISAEWAVGSTVKLVVYDLLGRVVATLADGRYAAGKYSFRFDAKGLSSGIYFYRLTAGSFSQTRKLCLLR
jgi:hypothetical protein